MQIHLIDENQNPVDLVKEDPHKMWVFNFQGKNLSLKAAGGNLDKVLHNTSASVEGLKKRLEFMGEDLSNCRFFGAYYSETDRNHVIDYNNCGAINPGVTALSEEILRTKIGSNHFLQSQAAVNAMGRVMFFGHCYGGMLVSSLEKALDKGLRRRGYSSEESSEILSAPKAIMTNVPLELNRQPKYFDTFSFANCSDYMLQTVPEYQPMRENIQMYGGFDKSLMFRYDDNPQKWQVPAEYKMKYMRVRGHQNYRLLAVNSMEIPSVKMLDAAIKYKTGLTREENGSENQQNKETFMDCQKAIVGGHELSCLVKPINIRQSEFMQKLQSVYLTGMTEQYTKTRQAYEAAEKERTTLKTAAMPAARGYVGAGRS